jgi:hypothetical protein
MKNIKEKYKFILIKVEIFESNGYYITKSFDISVGKEVEIIEIKDKYKKVEIKSESYIPTYKKLLFNKESKYLLNMPYQDFILLPIFKSTI